MSVVLGAMPPADVTVDLSIINTGSDSAPPVVSVPSSGRLVIAVANWNIPVPVTIEAVDDNIDDGDLAFEVEFTVTGGTTMGPPNVALQTVDDDTAGWIASAVGAGRSTEAGGVARVQVRPTSEPAAPVQVSAVVVSTTGPPLRTEATVTTAPVTFNTGNWFAFSLFDVAGNDDAWQDGDTNYDVAFTVTTTDATYTALTIPPVVLLNEDDDTVGITVSPTILTKATSEATPTATVPVTYVLDSRPTGNVIITLTSTAPTEGTFSPTSQLTFTDLNWNVAQNINVAAVDDDVDDDGATFDITATLATLDITGYSGFPVPTVTVENEDNDVVDVVLNYPATLDTSEAGATVEIEVKLGTEPTADVEVTLTPQPAAAPIRVEGTITTPTLTFKPAGGHWKTLQTFTVTGADDDYADGDSNYDVTYTVASADADYSPLMPTARTLRNLEDADAVGFFVTPTALTALTPEAMTTTTATVTAQLTSQPTADVIINVASSDPLEGTVTPAALTFKAATPGHWKTPQALTVAAVDDDVNDDGRTWDISFTTVATGETTGYATASAPPDVRVENVDDDVASIVQVVPAVRDTSEDGVTTFNVEFKLKSVPANPVTITTSCVDTSAVLGFPRPEGSPQGAPLTFAADATALNTQIATVEGVDDDWDDGDTVYQVDFAATSSDPDYNGLAIASIANANNVDDDSASITVSALAGMPEEANYLTVKAEYTVVLTSEPTRDVEITVTSDDSNEGVIVGGAAVVLTFKSADWGTPQTVELQAVDEDIDDDLRQWNALMSVSAVGELTGYDPYTLAPVTCQNTDNDAAAITVAYPDGTVTDESGGSIRALLKLATQPTSDVTIRPVPLQTGTPPRLECAIAAATLTSGVVFTTAPASWKTWQTITIPGEDDGYADGNAPYTVQWSVQSTDAIFAAETVPDLAATNNDDDAAGVAISRTSITGLTREDDTTRIETYTITLKSMPTDDVTITLTNADPAEGTIVSNSVVTFPPAAWNVPHTTQVAAVDDLADDDGETWTITHAVTAGGGEITGYAGVAVSDVVIENVDNDDALIVISLPSGTDSDENGGNFPIRLKLATIPTADVTITATVAASVNPTRTEASASAAVTFTSATWVTDQDITITGLDDDIADGDTAFVVNLAVTGDPTYAALQATLTGIACTNLEDADAVGVDVLPLVGILDEANTGLTATFDIKLKSRPSEDVTMILAKTTNPAEGNIVTPAGMELTFKSDATWKTAQQVEVAAVDDALDDDGTTWSVGMTIDTPTELTGYHMFSVSDVVLTCIDDDGAGISVTTPSGTTTDETGTITLLVVVFNTQPTSGVVTVAAAAVNPTTPVPRTEGVVTPGILTFTGSNWNVAQTFTVTGQDDDVNDGDTTYNVEFTVVASDTSIPYHGIAVPAVPITNTDNDVAGVTIGSVVGSPEEADPSVTGAFVVTLVTQPSGDVTVEFTSSDTDEGDIVNSGDVTAGRITFLASTWKDAKTVTVSAVDDAIDDDFVSWTAQATVTAVADATGYHMIAVADPVIVNVDDDVASVQVTHAPPPLLTSEDLTKTFQVSVTLKTEPQLPVTITATPVGAVAPVRNEGALGGTGLQLTFLPAQWNNVMTFTFIGVDDDYVDGDTEYTIDLTPSGDTLYTALAATVVTATNEDDADAVGVLVGAVVGQPDEAASTTTAEVPYSLTSRPTADVTLTFTPSDADEGAVVTTALTFNTANWATPQTVTVSAVNDDIDDDGRTWNVEGTVSASGELTGYSAGVAVPDAVITNIDDDAAGVDVTLLAGTDTDEDGAMIVTIQIKLKSEPVGAVTCTATPVDAMIPFVRAEGQLPSGNTLVFRDSDWSTPQTLDVSGVDDVIADGTVTYDVALGCTGTALYSNLVIPPVVLRNIDNDVATVSPSTATGNPPEADVTTTASFTLTLGTNPTGPVSVTCVPDDPAEGSVVTAMPVVWLVPDWKTVKTVAVAAVDDNVDDDGRTWDVICTVAAPMDTTGYAAATVSAVTVTNVDDDVAGVSFSAPMATSSEAGGTFDIAVTLDTEPMGPVTVGCTANQATIPVVRTEGSCGGTVTFTSADYAAPKVLTVTGVDDDYADGNTSYTVDFVVTGTYPPVSPVSLTAVNEDDDSMGVVVTPLIGSPDEANIALKAEYSIKLKSQPTADVTINVGSSDSNEGLISGASSLIFRPTGLGVWDTLQTVQVVAVDDFDDDDGKSWQVLHTVDAATEQTGYSTLFVDPVVVVNIDNDDPGVVVSTPTGATSSEGGNRFNVELKLKTRPVADVTVEVVPQDHHVPATRVEGVAQFPYVTFAPSGLNMWSTVQTVTVTGADDPYDDGDAVYTISLDVTSSDGDYQGLAVNDIPATNTDDDSYGVTRSAVTGNPDEADLSVTASFTYVLNSMPNAPVTITLDNRNVNEGTITVPSGPAHQLIFQPQDWDTAQTVLVVAVDDLVDDDGMTWNVEAAVSASGEGTGYAVGVSIPAAVIQNIDNDGRGVRRTIAGPAETSEEGGVLDIHFTLDTQPIAAVTVTAAAVAAASPTRAEGSFAVASVVIQAHTYSTAKTLTLTGVDDDYADGDTPYTVTFTAASSGDPLYNGIMIPDLTVTNLEDDDASGAVVSSLIGVPDEDGNTGTFTVALTSMPAVPVTIELINTDANEGTIIAPTSPHRLTFAPATWKNPQVVRVGAVDDLVDDDGKAWSVRFTASSPTDTMGYMALPMAAHEVTIINDDNDESGVTVDIAGALVGESNLAEVLYKVKLNSMPTGDVTVSIASHDTTEVEVKDGTPSQIVFAPADWNTELTLTLSGVDDDFDDGDIDAEASASVSSYIDPNYDAIADSALSTVRVTNIDDDTAGVTVDLGGVPALSVDEDFMAGTGTVTFDIFLSSRPTADVTINLEVSDPTEGRVSPTEVVFAAGAFGGSIWSTRTPIAVSSVNDDYDDGDIDFSVRITVDSADTEYSALAAPVGQLVTCVDDDVAGVVIGAPLLTRLDEKLGQTETSYPVALQAEPQAPVTITTIVSDNTEGAVPNALTFSGSNWKETQHMVVQSKNDDVVDGDVAWNIDHRIISDDAAYVLLTGLPSVAMTTVDDDTAGIVLEAGPTPIMLEEGSTGQGFVVYLTSEPAQSVTIGVSSTLPTACAPTVSSVVFTAANWDQPRTVEVDAFPNDVASGNQNCIIQTDPAVSVDANYAGGNPADVGFTIVDDDRAGVLLELIDTEMLTEAGGSARILVTLASEPMLPVTVTLTSSDDTEGLLAVPGSTASQSVQVIFTTSNWKVTSVVTVVGQDDRIDDDGETFDVAVAVESLGEGSVPRSYSNFHVAQLGGLAALDDDVSALSVSAVSGGTSEDAAEATFQVNLATEPVAVVTISAVSADGTEGRVDIPSVTFTPMDWKNPKVLTITGVDDDVDDGDVAYAVTVTPDSLHDAKYALLPAASVQVVNEDNGDIANVILGAVVGDTTEGGGQIFVPVELATRPMEPVTVTFEVLSATQEAMVDQPVVFTPAVWSVPQIIAVTGLDDLYADGDAAYQLRPLVTSDDAKYAALMLADMNAVNRDNDVADFRLEPYPLTALETTESGSVAIFGVRLASKPKSAKLDVSFTVGMPDEGTLSLTSLTFTQSDWDTSHSVTVTGRNDAVDDGDQTYLITTVVGGRYMSEEYAAVSFPDITVVNKNEDTADIIVSPLAGQAAENGGTATFTVVLSTAPAFDVRVPLRAVAVDGSEDEVYLPVSQLVFTPKNWNIPQTVVVIGKDDGVDDADQGYSVELLPAESDDPLYQGLSASAGAVHGVNKSAAPKDDGFPWWLIVLGVVLCALLCACAGLVLWKNSRDKGKLREAHPTLWESEGAGGGHIDLEMTQGPYSDSYSSGCSTNSPMQKKMSLRSLKHVESSQYFRRDPSCLAADPFLASANVSFGQSSRDPLGMTMNVGGPISLPTANRTVSRSLHSPTQDPGFINASFMRSPNHPQRRSHTTAPSRPPAGLVKL